MRCLIRATRHLFRVAVMIASCCLPAFGDSPAPAKLAEQIRSATGVTSGLIVHLNCGDGRLTAALAADPLSVVQGLSGDPADLRRARSGSGPERWIGASDH